jgi:hypothetical protein
MRPNRTNLILIGLLVVQIIAGVVIFWPNNTSTTQASTGPLIANYDPAKVTEITIHEKDKAITITRSGTGWILPGYENYPADSNSVTDFLTKLQGLQANRLIAQNPSSQIQLHVTDSTYERLIDIKQGDRVDHLYVGTSGGANATHMRLNDANAVYLTSGLAATDAATTVSSWINTGYFSVDATTITGLVITNAQGTFSFRKSNGAWTFDSLKGGEIFNTQSVDRLTNQLSSFSMTAPLGTTPQDKFKMTSPLATVTIITTEAAGGTPIAQPTLPGLNPNAPTATPLPPQTVQKTYTILIGAKLDNGDYAAKGSTSNYYADVIASIAETFTGLKRDDLITIPPTPTITPTPADF